MPRMRSACAALGGSLFAACAATGPLDGPLPVRNQHPAQLTVLHLPPASTRTLAKGDFAARVDAAYSSLFLSGAAPGKTFRMDGEILRVGTTLRGGLGGGLEIAGELPVAHTTGGFLDSFLIDYHDTFGFPDQNRDITAKGDFAVSATESGQPVWGMQRESLVLLDVPIWLTWQCTDPVDGLGVALRAGLEVPAGDDAHGYGNGEVDWSAGVLLEHRLGPAALYGHLQHTLAGTPAQSRRAGLPFADVTAFGIGAELPLADSLAALAQVAFETSTLRNLDLPTVGRDQVLLWLGARWRGGSGWAIELAFGEDLQSYVSPDFTAWLGFTTLPSGGGAGRP